MPQITPFPCTAMLYQNPSACQRPCYGSSLCMNDPAHDKRKAPMHLHLPGTDPLHPAWDRRLLRLEASSLAGRRSSGAGVACCGVQQAGPWRVHPPARPPSACGHHTCQGKLGGGSADAWLHVCMWEVCTADVAVTCPGTLLHRRHCFKHAM